MQLLQIKLTTAQHKKSLNCYCTFDIIKKKDVIVAMNSYKKGAHCMGTKGYGVRKMLRKNFTTKNQSRKKTSQVANNSYVVFSNGSAVYIRADNPRHGTRDISTLSPQKVSSLPNGAKIRVDGRNMSRVQVAHVIDMIDKSNQ